MKIDRFENIVAWQEARALSARIYRASRLPGFDKDFGLRDQIQRASISIMANISEGFDSGSRSEFIRFLNYASRSASEVQSHLYAALDQNYVTSVQFKELYTQGAHVKQLIGGFIRRLRHPHPRSVAP